MLLSSLDTSLLRLFQLSSVRFTFVSYWFFVMSRHTSCQNLLLIKRVSMHTAHSDTGETYALI